jgi:hypothetical protein
LILSLRDEQAKKFLNPQVPLISEANSNMIRLRAAKRQPEVAIEAATRSGNRSGNRSGKKKRQKEVRIEEL